MTILNLKKEKKYRGQYSGDVNIEIEHNHWFSIIFNQLTHQLMGIVATTLIGV